MHQHLLDNYAQFVGINGIVSILFTKHECLTFNTVQTPNRLMTLDPFIPVLPVYDSNIPNQSTATVRSQILLIQRTRVNFKLVPIPNGYIDTTFKNPQCGSTY